MQQGTTEWLEFRRNKIGCSDIPVIMGLVAQKSPRDLYFEKIDGVDAEPNVAMRHGTDTEPKAREYLAKLIGITYKPEVAIHPEHDFIMASLDGVDYSGERGCEIKCPYYRPSFEKRFLKRGPLDIDYCQMQGQMWVKGWESILYCCYWSESENFVSECRRNDEYIESIKQPVFDFWECLKNKTPPEDKYQYFDDVDAQETINKARRGKRMMLEGKILVDEAKIEALERSDYQPCKMGPVRVEVSLCKGNVDYKAIPELQGIDLEKYRKKSYTKYSLFVDSD